MPTISLNDLMTQANAAKRLKVKRQTIHSMIERETITVYEVDGKKFVSRAEIEDRAKRKFGA